METLTVTKVLTGHTSQETAYLVEDYPYGFTLRCKIRYWLEYKDGHGYRLVSQTTNPKKPVEVWNKPKSSTYRNLAVMVLDEKEHVAWDSVSFYDDGKRLKEFKEKYVEYLDEQASAVLAVLEKYQLVQERKRQEAVTRSCSPDRC